MERRVLRFALALLICASGVWAQTFSVKGVLRDPGGRTVDDGTFKMEFRLYEAETGGTKVWSEIQADVPVQHGVFSAELGVVQPLAAVSFLNPLFLGIAIEGHPEMAPRIKILPGPYSMAVLGVDNRFPSTGNVGVATTSPTEPLEVAGNLKLSNGGVLMFPDGTSLASADLGGTASSAASPGNLLLTADDDATGDGAVQLRTGSTTQVTVTGAGDVGIGTAAPSSKLSVAGNADVTGRLGIGTSTPSNPLSVTGNADITGNVGIGTAAPTNKLSVSGDANVTGRLGINLPTPDTDAHLSIGGIGSVIELGAGVADKQADAGKIMYRGYTDALEILGGGSSSARRLKFWAEQGAAFTGPLAVANPAIPGAGVGLDVGGGVKSYFNLPGIVGGAMTIDGNNGRVGIGTATPPEGLHVITGKTIGAPGAGVNIAGGNGGNAAIELVSHGGTSHIDFSNNNADDYDMRLILMGDDGMVLDGGKLIADVSNPSDIRIKNLLGVSDGARDLETLKGLEVVDYTHIDTVNMGKGTQKKLIAQQVQQVYPRAVNQIVNFVPSVYQMSASIAHHPESSLLTIGTSKEHGFAAGDTVRLYFGKVIEEKVVQQVVNAHTFAVEYPEAVAQVFVYGKKVHDFLSVDYDAVAMLNVSATQELARQVADLSARTEVLAQENAQLKAQVASLAAAETEKAAFEARLTHMEDTVVRVTAALQRFEEKDGATSGQVLLKVPSATLAQSR